MSLVSSDKYHMRERKRYATRRWLDMILNEQKTPSHLFLRSLTSDNILDEPF